MALALLLELCANTVKDPMKLEVLESFMTTAADLSALQLFLHGKDSDMFKTLLCVSEAKLSF